MGKTQKLIERHRLQASACEKIAEALEQMGLDPAEFDQQAQHHRRMERILRQTKQEAQQ